MDALAEGGVTFSNAHVTAPYCRPLLRTLATGLHPVDYQLQVNQIIEQRQAEDTNLASLEGRQQQLWLTAEKAAAMATFETLPKHYALTDTSVGKVVSGERTYEHGPLMSMTGGWTEESFNDDDFFLKPWEMKATLWFEKQWRLL